MLTRPDGSRYQRRGGTTPACRLPPILSLPPNADVWLTSPVRHPLRRRGQQLPPAVGAVRRPASTTLTVDRPGSKHLTLTGAGHTGRIVETAEPERYFPYVVPRRRSGREGRPDRRESILGLAVTSHSRRRGTRPRIPHAVGSLLDRRRAKAGPRDKLAGGVWCALG